jgi:hypothetical protein
VCDRRHRELVQLPSGDHDQIEAINIAGELAAQRRMPEPSARA